MLDRAVGTALCIAMTVAWIVTGTYGEQAVQSAYYAQMEERPEQPEPDEDYVDRFAAWSDATSFTSED